MSDKPLGSQQPGDAKNTAEKLAGDASSKAQSVGQNILDTGSHYADKAQSSDAGKTTTGAASNLGDSIKAQAGQAQSSDVGKQAEGVAKNIGDTAKTYADKAQASEPGQQATGIAQNIGDTVKPYADKAAASLPSAEGVEQGGKTYLEQAQDLATNALNTASKAASDLANTISGEKK